MDVLPIYIFIRVAVRLYDMSKCHFEAALRKPKFYQPHLAVLFSDGKVTLLQRGLPLDKCIQRTLHAVEE